MKKGYMRIIIIAFLMFLSNFQQAKAISYNNSNNYSNALNTPSQQLTGDVISPTVSEITTPGKPIIFTPQVGLPGFMSTTTLTSNSTVYIAKLMKEIFSYAIQIIAVIALIVIIIGGFLWSVAGGNGQKVSEAKQWIGSGLGGLILTLFSYLILSTINFNLVNFQPRKINNIVGLNLDIKSNPEQVIGDQGFLDHVYSIVLDKNPNSEACCIFYDRNTPSLEATSQIIAVSIAGSVIVPVSVVAGGAIAAYTAISDTIKTDNLSMASVAYNSNQQQDLLLNACLEYANGITKGKAYGNNATITKSGPRQVIILSKNDNTEIIPKPFGEWTIKEFKKQVEDLALFVVTDSACWGTNEFITSASTGLNSPNYCKNVAKNNNGWICITEENGQKYWGYCDNEKCQRCLTYGQQCSHDYQCPNRKTMIGKSQLISGWQCGNAGASGLNSNAATCDKTHHCECATQQCYEECKTNLKSQDSSLIKDVCQGK